MRQGKHKMKTHQKLIFDILMTFRNSISMKRALSILGKAFIKTPPPEGVAYGIDVTQIQNNTGYIVNKKYTRITKPLSKCTLMRIADRNTRLYEQRTTAHIS